MEEWVDRSEKMEDVASPILIRKPIREEMVLMTVTLQFPVMVYRESIRRRRIGRDYLTAG
ncbi:MULTISPECIES: hypothetical protein [Candidatus Ichthyocystis]|uniref:hypothetical protein n=1 Tax=Candidatus Ichthyocystis TaxID=2929841 RepID=UPI001111E6DD|nr:MULTISPECIES: hypothetical protein [Ichthyocystis]